MQRNQRLDQMAQRNDILFRQHRFAHIELAFDGCRIELDRRIAFIAFFFRKPRDIPFCLLNELVCVGAIIEARKHQGKIERRNFALERKKRDCKIIDPVRVVLDVANHVVEFVAHEFLQPRHAWHMRHVAIFPSGINSERNSENREVVSRFNVLHQGFRDERFRLRFFVGPQYRERLAAIHHFLRRDNRAGHIRGALPIGKRLAHVRPEQRTCLQGQRQQPVLIDKGEILDADLRRGARRGLIRGREALGDIRRHELEARRLGSRKTNVMHGNSALRSFQLVNYVHIGIQRSTVSCDYFTPFKRHFRETT